MKKTRAPRRAANRSFKRDIIFSAILHVVILAATVVSSPFQGDRRLDLGEEVIRVQLTAMPTPAAAEPAPKQPIQVPSAVLEDVFEDVPITDPSTKEKVVVPEKMPNKPKPKPKPKQTPPQQPQQAKVENSAPTDSGEKEIDAEGTGAGSPFAGATIDNASFEYPYWFTQAFNKIAQNYRIPIAYDGTLVCVVYFQVIRSGRMIEVRVEKSSGIQAFDDACLLAVERSAPFPPLPREFRDEVIGITIPFKSTP